MKFMTLMSAAVMAMSFGQAAKADMSDEVAQAMQLAQSGQPAPPPGHTGQWWTHPIGCEYSRAGRPGETVWYLIINTAKRGCPSYIVGYTPYRDVY